jgi:hypothetical protein
MGNYYERKAKEAHDGVTRRSREAHEAMEQRVHGKQPDARNTSRYKQGGEGSTTSEPQPKSTTKAVGKAAAASGDLLMVSLYSAASALGAVAAASLLGKRGRNN